VTAGAASGYTAPPSRRGLGISVVSAWCIEVYGVCMSRTNIDLDDELVSRAMRLYRLETKREAVNLALRKLVGEPMSVDEILAMQGTGWGPDGTELDDLYKDEVAEL
jgi:Arc/MetJ family transcription regulator